MREDAGTDETSLVLHLAAHLVDLSTVVRRAPEHLADYGDVRFGGPVSFGLLSDDFDGSGVIDDPTAATIEPGAELFTGAEAFPDGLAEVARFEFSAP